jgi:putative heme-binding domain-containing protein
LLSTAGSTEALLSALESGTLLADDLSPSVRQTLRQNGSQSLQARINRVLGKTAEANQELIQKYLQSQSSDTKNPDLSRGRELYRKHCATCHLPDAAGQAAGPDLSNLTDRTPTSLTEAILTPNRSVEPKYRSFVVLTTDGRALSGVIAEEAGETLTLALADGRRAVIQRSDIEEFRNTGISLMPEGFQQELDPGMLRDVIEYLRSDSFIQASGNSRVH